MHVLNILELVRTTLNTRGQQNGYDKDAGDVVDSTAEERSAAAIARIYTMLSGKETTTSEAWLFLISLKMARLQTQREMGKDVSDTVIDLVAYCALWGEEITSDKPEPKSAEQSEYEKVARGVCKILAGNDSPGEMR